MSGDFVGRPVIDRVLRMNDFELFASTRPRQPFEQNNTDPVWQRRGGRQGVTGADTARPGPRLDQRKHGNVHVAA